MHVRELLTRPRRRPLTISVLAATGAVSAVPLLALALVVVLLYPDGEIERMGPVSVEPAIPVLLLVPALLAVACAVSHGTWTVPVVRRNGRTTAARALSYVTMFALGSAVVWLGDILAAEPVLSGSLRNLCWMTGTSLATAALLGVAYAWLPVVIACGTAVLSATTENPWTLYGWLFHPAATDGQFLTAAAVLLTGLSVAVWDPRSPGYLRTW